MFVKAPGAYNIQLLARDDTPGITFHATTGPVAFEYCWCQVVDYSSWKTPFAKGSVKDVLDGNTFEYGSDSSVPEMPGWSTPTDTSDEPGLPIRYPDATQFGWRLPARKMQRQPRRDDVVHVQAHPA